MGANGGAGGRLIAIIGRRLAVRQTRILASALIVVAVVFAAVWVPGRLGTAAQDGTPAEATPGASVEVTLSDVAGAEVGTATFIEEDDGVVAVVVTVEGLPPGEHGIHVHAAGVCDPVGADPFASALGHFNPTGAAHGGAPNGALGNQVATPPMMAATPMATAAPTMGHAGDLGNITVGDDGAGELEIRTDRFTLAARPTTLFDMDGSSILIHEQTDDLMTDPAGMTGGRIACAVVAAPNPEATPAASITAPTPDQITGHAFNPERMEFSESLLEQLQAPDGFEVSVFATNMGNARMMAVAADGTVYVTRPDSNDVLALRDADGDGQIGAEETTVAASDLTLVHGIVIRENRLYLAGEARIWVADLGADGAVGAPTVLVDELPYGGQHPRRTIGFGPDGMLYVSVGSSCNACHETSDENATILRVDPESGGRTIFAAGLRNTIGWAWHPETGDLWGMDHGSDWRGDDQPPDELNRIVEGANYGWPYCYGDRQVDRYFSNEPVGATSDAYCALTEAAVIGYQAHSAPIGWVFYTAEQFPEEYRGDAYVAMRGSWNRFPAVGYEVVRVRFEDGQPVAIDDFVTGWLAEDGASHFGRIAGVAVAADGSLLVSEDTNGVIYRVSYAG